MLRTGFSLLLLLAPLAAARAQTAPPARPEAASGPRVLAVLSVEVNEAAKGQAAPVEALLASHLAETDALKVISQKDLATLIDVERQKVLLGQEEGCAGACASAVGDATGADLVLTSRLDRFGEQYVLTATLIDVRAQTMVSRPRAEAVGEAALPEATRALTAQLFSSLGAAPRPPAPLASGASAADGRDRKFLIGMKVGNTLLTELANFNLSGDVQVGYRFAEAWVGFVQVGMTLMRKGRLEVENVALVPSLLGVRHLYRLDQAFQPYWGLGLGVQVNLNSRFKFVQSHGVLPAVFGMGGFHYFFSRAFGVGVEASMNLAGTVVELASEEQLRAFNLNLHGTLTWRL